MQVIHIHYMYICPCTHVPAYVFIPNKDLSSSRALENLANKHYSRVWNQSPFQSTASLSRTPLCPAPFTGDEVRSYADLLGNFISRPHNSQHNWLAWFILPGTIPTWSVNYKLLAKSTCCQVVINQCCRKEDIERYSLVCASLNLLFACGVCPGNLAPSLDHTSL